MHICTQAVDNRGCEHPFSLCKLAQGVHTVHMATTTTRPKRLVGPMSRRLKAARTTAGLSRKALAERIGVSERAVNYYEDPKYARARKSYIVREWAEACGRDFEDIWGRAGQETARTGWSSGTAA